MNVCAGERARTLKCVRCVSMFSNFKWISLELIHDFSMCTDTCRPILHQFHQQQTKWLGAGFFEHFYYHRIIYSYFSSFPPSIHTDTFASKVAAIQDKYADASVGNVTGSNAVNVFLGIGVAWTIGTFVKNKNLSINRCINCCFFPRSIYHSLPLTLNTLKHSSRFHKLCTIDVYTHCNCECWRKKKKIMIQRSLSFFIAASVYHWYHGSVFAVEPGK